MKERYLLCPGWVTSRADGQQHFVSAIALANLYGVRSFHECAVLPPLKSGALGADRRRTELLDMVVRGELVALRPRADGDYRLPEARP